MKKNISKAISMLLTATMTFSLVTTMSSSALVFAKGPGNGNGSGSGGGGGETDTYGNNLSYPVIFAEGLGLTGLDVDTDTGLRTNGMAEPENFVDDGGEGVAYITEDDVRYYLQGTASTWEADWKDGRDLPGGGEVPIEVVWSDNLFSTQWSAGSTVRVEHALVTSAFGTMDGYAMKSFTERVEKQKTVEIQGTNADSVTSYPAAKVYSNYAWLTIQKLDEDLNPVGEPVVDQAAKAEINASGNVIYGFNWKIAKDAAGTYRITLSFAGDENVNVIGAHPLSATGGPTVNHTADSTSIDIVISATRSHKPTNPGGGEEE